MKVNSLRLYSFIPFFTTALLLAYAYYEQYIDYLDPCPLCMVQRLVFFIIGLLYLLTMIKPPQFYFRKIFVVLIVLVSVLGCVVSARHIWIQNLPADEVPACGPGLFYMLDNFTLGSVLQDILQGSGECAEISWRFIGLTMPMWTFICFFGFIIYTIIWGKMKNE